MATPHEQKVFVRGAAKLAPLTVAQLCKPAHRLSPKPKNQSECATCLGNGVARAEAHHPTGSPKCPFRTCRRCRNHHWNQRCPVRLGKCTECGMSNRKHREHCSVASTKKSSSSGPNTSHVAPSLPRRSADAAPTRGLVAGAAATLGVVHTYLADLCAPVVAVSTSLNGSKEASDKLSQVAETDANGIPQPQKAPRSKRRFKATGPSNNAPTAPVSSSSTELDDTIFADMPPLTVPGSASPVGTLGSDHSTVVAERPVGGMRPPPRRKPVKKRKLTPATAKKKAREKREEKRRLQLEQQERDQAEADRKAAKDLLMSLTRLIAGAIEKGGRELKKRITHPLLPIDGDGKYLPPRHVFAIHLASELGDLESIHQLHSMGQDMLCVDDLGATALYDAVGKGQGFALQLLFLKIEQDAVAAAGPNVATTPDPASAVSADLTAAAAPSSEPVSVVLDTLLKARDSRGTTLLVDAVRHFQVSMIVLLYKLLLSGRPLSAVPAVRDLANACDENGWGAVFWLLGRHCTLDIESAKKSLDILVGLGASLGLPDNMGSTPLVWAFSYADRVVRSYLPFTDGDVDAIAADGQVKFLWQFISSRFIDCFEADANVSDDDWASMVKSAKRWPDRIRDDLLTAFVYRWAAHGNMRWLTTLKKDELAYFGGRLWGTSTALHAAVEHDNQTCVAALLKAGVSPNVRDADGKTALHQACHDGSLPLVRLLLRQPDIDVCIRDNNFSHSPLTEVVGMGFKGTVELRIVRLLIAKGADLQEVDDDGYSVLHWALDPRARHSLGTIKLLLESLKEQDITEVVTQQCTVGGNTVLHMLCSSPYIPTQELKMIVEFCDDADLLEHVLSLTNNWGFTAFELAYCYIGSLDDNRVQMLRPKGGTSLERRCRSIRAAADIALLQHVPKPLSSQMADISCGVEAPHRCLASPSVVDALFEKDFDYVTRSEQAAPKDELKDPSFLFTAAERWPQQNSTAIQRRVADGPHNEYTDAMSDYVGCLCYTAAEYNIAPSRAIELVHGCVGLVYGLDGRLTDDFLNRYLRNHQHQVQDGRFAKIWECHSHCRCAMTKAKDGQRCPNRVVGRADGKVQFDVAVFEKKTGEFGLRTLEDIPRGSLLVEYVGEVVRSTEELGREQSYLMDIWKEAEWENSGENNIAGAEFQIDSLRKGNCSRFVNHSHTPNLIAVEVFLGDSVVDHAAAVTTGTANRPVALPRACLFAQRDIVAGEELTFDYLWKPGHFLGRYIPCDCGCGRPLT